MLKRDLQKVVAVEDFDKAIEIRNQLKGLEKRRDNFDALYETGRYESMIVMK